MRKIQLLLERFPAFFKAGTVPNLGGTGAVLAILAVLLLTSCQTKKQFVKSETEIKTVSELNTTKDAASKTDTHVFSNIAESVTETDSTVIEETITELSKPDSLGHQHPEKIINRKITSGKNKETKVVEETQHNQTTENKVSETENRVTEQVISNETAEKTKIKKHIPWKLIGSVIALAGIGLFLWIRFFKRMTGRFNLF